MTTNSVSKILVVELKTVHQIGVIILIYKQDEAGRFTEVVNTSNYNGSHKHNRNIKSRTSTKTTKTTRTKQQRLQELQEQQRGNHQPRQPGKEKLVLRVAYMILHARTFSSSMPRDIYRIQCVYHTY